MYAIKNSSDFRIQEAVYACNVVCNNNSVILYERKCYMREEIITIGEEIFQEDEKQVGEKDGRV